MHELTLAETMIELIEEKAAREKFSRVAVVHLEIGLLSHAEPEALAFCFDSVAAGRCAEGARLEIKRVETIGKCPACHHETIMENRYSPCPQCGTFGLSIIRGADVRISSIVVTD